MQEERNVSATDGFDERKEISMRMAMMSAKTRMMLLSMWECVVVLYKRIKKGKQESDLRMKAKRKSNEEMHITKERYEEFEKRLGEMCERKEEIIGMLCEREASFP